MIQEFVSVFMSKKHELEEVWSEKHPESYENIFSNLIQLLASNTDYGGPDPERIVVVDHGDYQGTRLFVVAAKGYQPSTYWTCKVDYGSCSGCDSFEAIRDEGYSSDGPTPEQVKGYVTMALHMVQEMKEI